MLLLRITIIAIAAQCIVEGIDLPTLPGNRLLTGAARDLPGAKVIDCVGERIIVTYKSTNNVLNLSDAVSKFGTNVLTAMSVVPGPISHGGVGKFSFMEVKPQSGPRPDLVYGLQLDVTGRSGESAYWLPQGGHIDVPAVPDAGVTPHTTYVFTPDFSGCSWTVTPMANGYLRLRHVNGGREDAEFNNLNEATKGGPVTYAMQYKDYGYIRKDGKLISNVPAYAYMHYNNGRWEIHVQHQSCAPRPGTCTYDRNRLLQTMKSFYYDQQEYNWIYGTLVFTVPNGH